jgi:hypothetical protein
VLTVPIEGIVGSAELGAKRQCYVLTPDNRTEVRDIVVGQSNDTKAEIREGLKEGDVVVLNPGAIIGDSAKVRKAGQGKGDSSGDGDAEKGKGKKKGGPDKAKGKGGPGKDGKREGGPGSFNPDAVAERFHAAAPAERKKMLEQTPEQFREKLREMLKGKGIDVPK